MKLKRLFMLYVLFLIVVSVSVNAQWQLSARTLLRTYAPASYVWLSHHAPPRIPYDDKLAHFGLAGMLSLLLNLVLRLATISIGTFKMLKGNLWVLLCATLEEGSQAWFPHRSVSLSDLLANYAGILCFGCIAIWLVKHRQWIATRLPRPLATLIGSWEV